jgi:hypothetical protein
VEAKNDHPKISTGLTHRQQSSSLPDGPLTTSSTPFPTV